MQSQVIKLAVICNACFWLTIVFKYWKNARNIQPDVLNTILILGMVAVLANIIWLVYLVIGKRHANAATENSKNMNKKQPVFFAFNLLSLIAQIVYLAFKFD